MAPFVPHLGLLQLFDAYIGALLGLALGVLGNAADTIPCLACPTTGLKDITQNDSSSRSTCWEEASNGLPFYHTTDEDY